MPPHQNLELDLESYFSKRRESDVNLFREQRARSKVGVARRLSELDRLNAPSREIILGDVEREEDRQLAGLIASLTGQEFQARQGLAELGLKERELAMQEQAFQQALAAQSSARRSRRRGGLGRVVGSLAGAGIGALLAAPTGGLSLSAGLGYGAALGGATGGGFADAFGGL